MSRLRLALGTLLTTALLAPAAASATPLARDDGEGQAAAGERGVGIAGRRRLAWVQNSRLHPHLYNLYAQVNGGARFRVNPANTQAGLGTGIDGHTLVFTQLHGAKSSIRLFDLQTRRASGPPVGVNTANAEDEPSVSGGWLLYHRTEPGSPAGQQVLLTNLSTGKTRTLASVPGRRGFLEAGR